MRMNAALRMARILTAIRLIKSAREELATFEKTAHERELLTDAERSLGHLLVELQQPDPPQPPDPDPGKRPRG